MSGLSIGNSRIDSFRFAVAELLIKKIGKELETDNIKNFKKNESSPRAYFLGVNPITDSLHWIFINDSYKISAYDKLPQCVKSQIQGKVNNPHNAQPIIMVDDAIDQLRKTSKDMLVVDPTRFLESPKTTGFYPKDQEQNLQLPIIYENETKRMKKLDIKQNYDGKLGLSMRAFNENAVFFSPYSILDPRSCEPGYWDVMLGIETTIYLPIELDGKVFGVLAISQDIENAQVPNWTKPTCPEELHNKIDIDNDYLRIKTQYKYLTEDKAKNCEKVLQTKWDDIKKHKDICSGIEILSFLFDTIVKYYNEYVFHFDDNIIELNQESVNNSLKQTLIDVKKPDQSSTEIVTKYIDSLSLPTLEYIKDLHRIEPLLQNIGKKEHYIHMFNVFLLGRVLWKHTFREYPNDNLWQEIALSHDITYPIEAIEEEIEDFFEIYFHNKKTPRFLISGELFYSYGQFGKFLHDLIEGATKELVFSKRYTEIFEDLVLFNFHSRRDHAILSALFTITAFIGKGRTEEEAYKVALPIFLHNLYQWKFYAHQEILDFEKKLKDKEPQQIFQVRISQAERDIKFENSCLVSFVYERRFKKELDKITDDQGKKDKLEECLKKYRKDLYDIQIKVERNCSEIKKNIFILALADFWQEWGRATFRSRGLASIGIRMSILDNNLSIIVPFIAYSKDKYLLPKRCLSYWEYYDKTQKEKTLADRDKYFGESSDTDKNIKDEIKLHIQNDLSGNKKEGEKAIYKQNMLKLWEYVRKFSSFENNRACKKTLTPDNEYKIVKYKGLFSYTKGFLQITWKGIRDAQSPEDHFRWPNE